MTGNSPSNNNFSPEEPDKNLVSQFVPPVAPPLAVYDVVVASAIAIEAGLVYVQWHDSKEGNLKRDAVRFDPNKTDAQTAIREHFTNKRVEIKPEVEQALGGFARHEVDPYDTRHVPEASRRSLGGFERQAPPDSNDTQHAPEPETRQDPYISPKGIEPLAPSIDYSKDNNRISNPYQMKKNYEAAYGKLPSGYQIHHLMPDAVVQKQPLARESWLRAKYNLDRASNLAGIPGTVKAYEESALKLFHSGQHKEWNDHAERVLGKEQTLLKQRYGSLDKIPVNVLEKTMKGIENQLRGDLQNVELGIKKGWIKPDYPKDQTKVNKISEASPNQGIEKADTPKQSEGNNDEFVERLNSITERLRGNSATLGQNRVASRTTSADLEQIATALGKDGAASGQNGAKLGAASTDLERTFAEYKSNHERFTAELKQITPLVEPPVRPKLELGGLIQAEPQDSGEQSADFDQLMAERWQKSVSASLEIQRQQSGGQDGPVLEL